MPATRISLNMQSNPMMARESRPSPLRIALVGNHLPRQCGIATFTTDLGDAIAAEYGADCLSVVAVNDGNSPYVYPERVRF